MTPRPAIAVLVLLALPLLAGLARADGAFFADGTPIGPYQGTTIQIATGAGLTATLTFTSAGAPILNGVTLDLRSTTPTTWTLTAFTSDRITLSTSTPTSGTIRVQGLNGDMRMRGLPGDVLVSGADTLTQTFTSATLLQLDRDGLAPTTTTGDTTTTTSGNDDEDTPSAGFLTARSTKTGLEISWPLAAAGGILLLIALVGGRKSPKLILVILGAILLTYLALNGYLW